MDIEIYEDDYEREEIADIDIEIEAYEAHLEHRCDPVFCDYCFGETL